MSYVHIINSMYLSQPSLSQPSKFLIIIYGQFSEFHVCFCGLDPGNLKFETVRTNKQRICF